MELASQECCLHSVLFTRRYVTFVLVIITFVFTLYNVVSGSGSGSYSAELPKEHNALKNEMF